MDFFFKPRGVAVIGATPNPLKGGNAILRNLLLGYRGGIYPVNPKYPEIDGVRCYPSVGDVTEPVDLAIVFVPAPQVPAAVEACAAKGVPGIMIESGGFAETGPEGARLQAALRGIAARTGVRLWGPNCMGLVDVTHSHIFSFMDPQAQAKGLIPGCVSLVVQSGMLSAGFLVDIMSHATMGVSKVCSVGNKADVNECDLLEYLLDDPDTEVIGFYLESFPDGRRFLDLCRRSAKPICVLKGGISSKGAQAALSHTASLAGDRRIVAGALAQAGVIEARDFKQLMDLCRTLALTKPSSGNANRVAVLTFSGGAGIVATDFLEGHGLALTELTETTRGAIGNLFPAWMPVTNPVDLWPAMERHIGTAVDVYDRALSALLEDPGVDAVFFHAYVGSLRVRLNLPGLAARIRGACKPVVFWLLGHRDQAYQIQKEALELGIPTFEEISRAAECLAAALGPRHRPEAAPPDTARGLPPLTDDLEKLLETASGPLDEHRSKAILKAWGFPTVAEEIARDASQAEAAAGMLGYPVVMKGLLSGGIHKTEMGLVKLGVSDPEACRGAFDSLMERMEGRGKVLIQKQIAGKVELILGLMRDPQFGPCVMFGLGGVTAELYGDTAFAVAPLSRREALALIGRIRGQKMLDGFRGAPAVDREAIASLLVALGRVGVDYPRIGEIDINPLLIGTQGAVAVDATIVLR
jgi:acetyltransferase